MFFNFRRSGNSHFLRAFETASYGKSSRKPPAAFIAVSDFIALTSQAGHPIVPAKEARQVKETQNGNHLD